MALIMFDSRGVPLSLIEGVKRYLFDGIEPGGFLQALLKNNLRDAMQIADPLSQLALPLLIQMLTAKAPATAWGSPQAYAEWLRRDPDRRRRVATAIWGRTDSTAMETVEPIAVVEELKEDAVSDRCPKCREIIYAGLLMRGPLHEIDGLECKDNQLAAMTAERDHRRRELAETYGPDGVVDKLKQARDSAAMIEGVATAENVRLQADLGAAIERVRLLEGAARADDERLIAAAKTAGVLYCGCDTPGHLADEVVAMRDALAAAVANSKADAAMTGRQMDLARQAEIERDAAIKRAEKAEED